MPDPIKTGLVALVACLAFSCSYLPEEQEISSGLNLYEYRDYLVIIPASDEYSKTGLVFYPGGLVDPHSYIEPLSRFAVTGKGHVVVIVKMPGNLAVLDSKQGAWIFEDVPAVTQWVIGGHSLGGVMACSVVDRYPDFFKGLVLMAAYPQASNNLKDWEGSVLSLRGQHDGLVDSLKLASCQDLLPEPLWISRIEDFPTGTDPKTVYFTIPGGNHSQFGNYGFQKGDGEATITPEEQAQLVSAILLRFYYLNGWEYDSQ